MKIMIIASWYPETGKSASGSFFRDRARELARNGCEVSVAVAQLRLRTRGMAKGICVERNCGVTEYRYFKRNLTPFWEAGIAKQQVPMIREIYGQICRESGKPDVIHLESARCAFAAVPLAKKEQIPLIYTEHYSGIMNSRPGSYYDRIMKMAVSSAAHTFLISSAVQKKLCPPEGKYSIMPNGVDFSEFHIAQPKGIFTFCALGSLRSVKGYDILLRAFSQVYRAAPRCRLVIGGSGEEEKNLKKLCEELSLTDCVQFAGHIPLEKRDQFYGQASAFVCSSRLETFSVVTVEALACGIPVVATKCGGPEDIVCKDNGYLVENNNVSALAEGMLRMLENRQYFSSENIRANAFARYDRERLVKRQIECYRTVVCGEKHE